MVSLPPPAFGSPSSHARGAPNLIFLIDSKQLSSSLSLNQHHNQTTTANLVRFLVLKTLLYFYLRVDSRLSWAFQIFDQNDGKSYAPPTKHNHTGCASQQDVRPSALAKLDAALQDSVKNTNSNSDSIIPSAVENIASVLKKALVDFGWSFVPQSGFFQSPAKVAGRRATKQNAPVRIRNHLFLLAPAPKTTAELQEFVYGTSASSCTIDTIDHYLSIIQTAFLGDGLLDGYLDKRTSINWIDTQWLNPESLDHKITPYIHHSICAILRAYGGSLIPAHVLMNDASIVHFSVAFSIYRPKTVEPNIGRALLPDNSFQDVSSLSRARRETVSKLAGKVPTARNPTLWSGNLIDGQTQKLWASFQLISMTLNQSARKASKKRQPSPIEVPNAHSPFQDIPTIVNSTFDSNSTMETKGDVALFSIDKAWLESETYLAIPPKHCNAELCDSLLSLFQFQLLGRRGLVVEIRHGSHSKYESLLGILSGLALGVGCLRMVKKDHVQSLMNVVTLDTKEYIDWSVVNSWYAQELDAELMEFFFQPSLEIHKNVDFNELAKASLGVWDADAKFSESENSLLHSSIDAPIERGEVEEEQSSLMPSIKYSSVEEALKDMKRYCILALYSSEKMPLLTLLGADGLYQPMQYLHKSTIEPHNPFALIFEQFASNLLIPIPGIEKRYQLFPKVFEFSFDDGCKQLKNDGMIDEMEADALLQWMNRWEMTKIQEANYQSNLPNGHCISLDRRKIICDGMKELRVIEAQLQIVLILELLRLSLFTREPIPAMSLLSSATSHAAEGSINGNRKLIQKRKSLGLQNDSTPTKRRKSGNGTTSIISDGESPIQHLSQVAEEWMDLLCIWGSIAGFEDGRDKAAGVSGFAAGVLKMMYQSQLPELVDSLLIKSGATTEVGQPSPAPPEPFTPLKAKSKKLPSKIAKQALINDRPKTLSSESGCPTSRLSERVGGTGRSATGTSTHLSSSAPIPLVKHGDGGKRLNDGVTGRSRQKRHFETKLLKLRQRQIALPKAALHPKDVKNSDQNSKTSNCKGSIKSSKQLGKKVSNDKREKAPIDEDCENNGSVQARRRKEIGVGARIGNREQNCLFSPSRSSAHSANFSKLLRTPPAAIGVRSVPDNPFLDAEPVRRKIPSPPKAPDFLTPARGGGGLHGGSGAEGSSQGSRISGRWMASVLVPPTPIKDGEMFSDRVEETPTKNAK